jgi:hypothetical protein
MARDSHLLLENKIMSRFRAAKSLTGTWMGPWIATTTDLDPELRKRSIRDPGERLGGNL